MWCLLKRIRWGNVQAKTPLAIGYQPSTLQYHGSVYGVIPAKRGFLKPVGEWNEQVVTVKGSKIKVELDGNIIVDGDFQEASKNGTMDKHEHPGLQRTGGHIGFLGHGDIVRFRNIQIKELLSKK